VLKLAPQVVALPLTWIINKIIQEGEIPQTWKEGRILPLHKKKEKHKVENYRPVCILPSPSKVMEKVVRRQLAKYVEAKNILPRSQYGFRQGRSTTMTAGAADHDWRKAKRDGMRCGALFFDLSAAFDTLDTELLVKKLEVLGAAENVLRWVGSYLTGRRQRVDWDGPSSKMISITAGSPQGSVISALLFLIMTCDLEEWLSEGMSITLAGDTTCYAVAQTREEVHHILEKSAKEILAFMKASMLSANPDKTKFLMFGRAREESITVGDVLVTESTQEELLGITFNKSLSWKSHLEKLEPELRKTVGILRRMT
jgi:hypothetical protein